MTPAERAHFCVQGRADGASAETIAGQLSALERREITATTVRRVLRDWDEASESAQRARARLPAASLRRWLTVSEPVRAA